MRRMRCRLRESFFVSHKDTELNVKTAVSLHVPASPSRLSSRLWLFSYLSLSPSSPLSLSLFYFISLFLSLFLSIFFFFLSLSLSLALFFSLCFSPSLSLSFPFCIRGLDLSAREPIGSLRPRRVNWFIKSGAEAVSCSAKAPRMT